LKLPAIIGEKFVAAIGLLGARNALLSLRSAAASEHLPDAKIPHRWSAPSNIAFWLI
jgi:hypothetical protein